MKRLTNFPFAKVNEMLEEINSSFYAINSGGCAAMAHILARNLEKAGYPSRIAIKNGSWSGEFDENNDLTSCLRDIMDTTPEEEWSLCMFDHLSLTWSHLWVEFEVDGEWFSMDSTGIQPLDQEHGHNGWGKPLDQRLAIKQTALLAYRCSGWNRAFARDQIPGIAKIVASYFRQIFKEKSSQEVAA